MLATEIIETITNEGGQIWLENDKVRARLPESLRPLVSVIRSHKQQLIMELAKRPSMPTGLHLVRWQLKNPPIQLSQFEQVKDVDLFVTSTLRQIENRLLGKSWLAGNWSLSALLDRLEACGCVVILADPKKAVQ